MNPNDDPIAKQAAIVSGITQGEVVWTATHREALKAAMNRDQHSQFSDEIWADVLKVVCRLMATMPDYKKGKEKAS